jgi:hypothetical protein
MSSEIYDELRVGLGVDDLFNFVEDIFEDNGIFCAVVKLISETCRLKALAGKPIAEAQRVGGGTGQRRERNGPVDADYDGCPLLPASYAPLLYACQSSQQVRSRLLCRKDLRTRSCGFTV